MALCHRCGEAVPEDAAFCPHCGAPQLYVAEEDAPATTESAPAPPPRPGIVDWSAGMRSAAITAVIGLMLYISGVWIIPLTLLSVVWVLVAGQFAVNLYRKARPQVRLDGTVGARVGAATGVMLAAAKAIALSGTQWLERYPLHRGAEMDAVYAQAMQQSQQMLQKMFGTMAQSEQMKMMLSPEYRAWSSVAEIIVGGLIIFLIVTAGGALSGFLHKRRRPAA